MAKVGLKDTLALLAKGYSKKEIDALAAVDEEIEQEAEDTAKNEKQEKEATAPVEDKKEPEPDYKKMYEDLLAKNKESEAKITKLQKDNIHKDSSEISYEEKKKEEESLQALVRGFM